MKKIRLTESQLIDLIKKSVNEVKTINESRIIKETTQINAEELAQLARNLKLNLGGGGAFGDVQSKHLKAALANISAVKDYVWEDGTCAIEKLLAYYKSYNGGTDFLTSLANASESNDPEFDDLKAKIPNVINQLRQACAAAKQKDVNDAETKKNGLKNCAKNEKGFVEFKDGPNGSDNGRFGIGEFGKKGYLIISNNGASFTTPPGFNTIYWEYAKFHPKQGKDVAIAKTNASCVNGQISLDAWVKY